LVFLRERLGSGNAFGIFLALIGIVIVMTGGSFSSAEFSSSTFVGDLLIIGSAVCWAIYTVLGKSVLERYKPLAVTIINMAIGTSFLVVVALAMEDLSLTAKVSVEAWAIILYLAFFCSGLAYVMWYESLSDLAASRAGAFLFTIPVYTILMAHFAIGEAITGSTVFGAALVIVGVYLAERVR
jgi:drug/metabolite transporter (DMT)-like permease